jgi:hypothetical protein
VSDTFASTDDRKLRSAWSFTRTRNSVSFRELPSAFDFQDFQPAENGAACPIMSCQFGTMFTGPAARRRERPQRLPCSKDPREPWGHTPISILGPMHFRIIGIFTVNLVHRPIGPSSLLFELSDKRPFETIFARLKADTQDVIVFACRGILE